MAAESELWDLIARGREGVLGTVRRGGLPQLSNVLYLPEPGGRTVRISTTADRLKARVLARDPRAVLHVTGDSFWAYAVAEGRATLTPAAAEPGDAACLELLEVHSAFYGSQDEDAFFAASSSASSCAEPMCSIWRDPRLEDHTIWTAV